MARPRQTWDEINARKSERYSQQGKALEKHVCIVLQAMEERGAISSWRKTKTNGDEDANGKDFFVRKGEEQVAFGVTISRRSFKKSRVVHHHTPQLLFPIGTKNSTIERRILDLFSGKGEGSACN